MPALATSAAEPTPAGLQQAATFYASFDEAVRGDFGRGTLTPSPRFNHETEPGQFVFQPEFDRERFTIAAGQVLVSSSRATQLFNRSREPSCRR